MRVTRSASCGGLLIYMIAQAPWGPIKIETAASVGDMLRRITTQPAHVEPCDDVDAGQVADAACKLLPAADETGWTSASVAAATGRLVKAKRAVSARVVAAISAKPALGATVSQKMAIGTGNSGGRPARKRQRAPAVGEMLGPVVAPDVDPAAVRARLGMTQATFAAAFGLSVGTVRDWEQNRYRPEGPARTLLAVIAHRPKAVREALAASS